MIPENKKIALLHPQLFEVWWASKMMFHLCRELSKINQVVFFTTKYNQNNFSNKFCSVKEISSRFKIISYIKIAYLIKNYDIVFCWNSPMHLVGVLSKILFRAKFKLIWWNHHYPWYHEKKHNTFLVRLKACLEKFFIKYVDVLVANSLYIRDSLLDIFGQSRQIKILHPVVSSVFAWNKGKDFRQNSKITLFTYSRWVSWKNIDVIFELFMSLNKKYKINLFIWGEGKQLEKYKEKFSKYDNISFLWKLNEKEILSYWKKSDIFLFPSLIDSFWLSVLEMMFLSLPIIAFDSWWVFELVKNWKNGFLCKSNLEFMQKTELLIKDSLLRKKMSKESYNIAVSNFMSNFNKELIEVFPNY